MRLFFCYSSRLYKALIENGFSPLGSGLHPDTLSKFYIFEGTDEFNDFKNNAYQEIRKQYVKDGF